MPHQEHHKTHRSGWLRAAVLGANDGIVSTASLLIGVAAADAPRSGILLAGAAGLVAGAMSMAAGEYVSVSSQADIEHADLAIERHGIESDHAGEQDELSQIYVERGLTPALAREVAIQLMRHDALAAHARDELGISRASTARPIQAALVSGACFTAGAALPLATYGLAPATDTLAVLAATSLIFLAILGAAAARTGGANTIAGALRVLFWGAAAMALTAAVGTLFKTGL